MATANEEYRDAALRHQIGVRRYSAGLMKRIAALLEKADAELTLKLRARLAAMEGKPVDFTSERWTSLLAEMREARSGVMLEYQQLTRTEVQDLASIEAQKELDILTASVPIDVAWVGVAKDQLRAIVSSRPFQGKLLKDWFSDLSRADQGRIQASLQLGMAQGEGIDEVVRRIVGTRAQGYADGVMAVTRRDATTIARTAVNHVSNNARDMVWEANADIIGCKIWSSTLDGRTSAVCRARDGKGSAVGDNPLPAGVEPLSPPNAKPPAHLNCRSTLVAYIDGIGLVGNRPFVRDTRTRAQREVDFRKLAKQQGVSIQDVRKAWAAKNIGRVPSETTYQDFLKRQPAEFQDQVLGKAKGRLFRSGGLSMDQFVDRAGNELSLAELADSKPEAFVNAGLDPNDY